MNPSPAPRGPSLEEIIALTFHFYLQTGCPDGAELHCWREAEKALKRCYSARLMRAEAGPAATLGDRSLASLVADLRRRLAGSKAKAVCGSPLARPAQRSPQV